MGALIIEKAVEIPILVGRIPNGGIGVSIHFSGHGCDLSHKGSVFVGQRLHEQGVKPRAYVPPSPSKSHAPLALWLFPALGFGAA